MPDGVVVRDPLPEIENDAERVNDAACCQKPDARRGQGRHERLENQHDAPAEKQIKQAVEPLGPLHEYGLQDDACERDRPDRNAEHRARRPLERDETERSVRTRDHDIDRRMVKHLQNALDAEVRDGMVERRSRVEKDHRRAEHCGGRDRGGARRDGHHAEHHDEPRNAQQRSDAVRHRIGDLLACRIAADCGRRTVERHACKSSFKSYILYSCEIKGGNEMSGL